MICVITGVDGVGKSSLAKRLSKEFRFPIIKMKVNKKVFDNIELCSYIFNHTIAQFKSEDFILDRGVCDSIVYSKLYHRKEDLSYIKKIVYELRKELFIIYLYASPEVLKKRRKSDRFFDFSNYKKTLAIYSQVLNRDFKNTKVFKINTNDLNEKEVFEKVREILSRHIYVNINEVFK